MKHLSISLAAGLLLSSITSGGLTAAEALKPQRLWLPSSQENLRDLLVAAAERALVNPECAEVLYGRLNEYRTENEETAFTILCMRDPRYTFNLVFNASGLEASEGGREDVSNTEDLRRLRELLGDIPASVRSGINVDDTQQEPEDNTEPVLF